MTSAADNHPSLMRSREEWLNIKPIFLQLYLDEEKPLREVRQILHEQHEFTSTEKAFKRKIKQWGARKNLTKTEKEALAEAKRLGSHSDRIPAIHSIDESQIKWHRVFRHEADLRRQRRRGERATYLHVQPNGKALQIIDHRLFAGLQDDSELCLRAVRHLTLQMVSGFTFDIPAWIEGTMWSARLMESIADLQVPNLRARAWKRLNRSCHAFYMNREKFRFVIWFALVALATGKSPKSLSQLHISLFSYLRNLSCLTLAEKNTMNPVAQYIPALNDLKNQAHQIMMVQFESLEFREGDTLTLAQLKLGLFLTTEMEIHGFWDQAQSSALSMLALVDDSDSLKVNIIEHLAECCYRLRRYEESMKYGNDIILRWISRICAEDLDESSHNIAATFHTLSKCCQKLGDEETAVRYQRFSFATACRHSRRREVLNAYSALKTTLTTYKRWDELTALYSQHGSILECCEEISESDDDDDEDEDEDSI